MNIATANRGTAVLIVVKNLKYFCAVAAVVMVTAVMLNCYVLEPVMTVVRK